MNNLSLVGDTYLPNLYANSFSVVAWLTVILTLLFTMLIASVFYLVTKVAKIYINISD